ncbi:hypothetical protein AMATHDRAFT_5213 [Amanita thiersii Skay4041]|uniref:Secreted protein n=1 Tax=Amanita thiersii Skay4041 TaxID=703135 RepID=A0A2A9NG62_9AGAR|nr:hypothetical protein AMATHDRAFT_5213 [Amanita thiersii Skay4041]
MRILILAILLTAALAAPISSDADTTTPDTTNVPNADLPAAAHVGLSAPDWKRGNIGPPDWRRSVRLPPDWRRANIGAPDWRRDDESEIEVQGIEGGAVPPDWRRAIRPPPWK